MNNPSSSVLRPLGSRPLFRVAAALALGAAPLGWGASDTWTGAGADSNWSTTGNWTTAVPGTTVGPFISPDVATISGTAQTTITLDGSYNIASLVLGNAVAADFTLDASNGASLLLSAATGTPTATTNNAIINNSAAPTTAGAHFMTINAPLVLQNTSGTSTGSGTLYFAANGGSAIDAPGARTSFLRITGGVTGSASAGNTSTLVLYGGNNTRGLGGNEISGVIGDGANGGALALNFTQGNSFGTNGSTLWILSGANTYSGGTTIANPSSFSGTLQVRNNAALGSGAVTWASGSNVLSFGTSGLDIANDQIVNAGQTARFDTGPGSGTLSGAISGNNIIKQGANKLTLTGANTYTGTTTIAAGALSVASLNSVSGGVASSNLGAPITVADGTISMGAGGTAAQLIYTGTGETTDRVINLAGTTGGAILDQSGTGALRFTSNLTATGAGTKTLTLQGSTAGTGEISGVIGDNLGGTNNTAVTKTGTGLWLLSGANTYTGVTTVSAGTLLLGSATALGNTTGATTVASGATLDLNGQTISETLTVAGTGVGAAGALINGNAGVASTVSTAFNFNGASIGGAGDLALFNSQSNANVTKVGAGTLTLGGTATALGTITVNGGTVVLAHTGNTISADSVTVNSGTLKYDPNNTTSPGGDWQGQVNSTVNLAGSGATWDLSGTSGNNNRLQQLTGVAGSIVTNSNATAANFTIRARNAIVQTFAGNIQDGVGTVAVNIQSSNNAARVNLFSGNNTYSGATTVTDTTLRAGSTTGLSANSAVVMGTATTAILDLNGFDNRVASLAGGNATGGRVTLGAATLTVGNGTNTSYAGVISGSGGLTKVGSGTQTLTGANTYTGTTRLSDGILQLSATGSLSGTTSFVFDLTNDTHGQLAVENATFSYNGSLVFNIGAVTTSGSVTLFGGSEFQGSDLTLMGITSDATAWTDAGGGVWTLSNFGDNSFNGSFDQNLGTLSFTAVPEPHQYALIVGGLLFVVIVMRRRRASIED